MAAEYKSSKLNDLLAGLSLSSEEGREAFLKKLDAHLLDSEKSHTAVIEKLDRLNLIVELIPNTISWIGRDRKYIAVNSALAKTCNLRPEDFVGQPVGFHTKENFLADFVDALFKSTNKTMYHHLDVKVGGLDKAYLISGTKLEGDEKAVVIGLDITELKALQQQLSLTEKLATLGEMLAGILHDINNPLMIIDGSVQRLRRFLKEDQHVEILSKIQFASEKIAKITSGVKVFTYTNDQEKFSIEKLDAIIDDAITICQARLKNREIQVEVDPQLKNKTVIGHYTQLFQVFVNLISNASDAIGQMPEPRWIRVALSPEQQEGWVRVRVIDCGAGIPQTVADKIFTAFFTTKSRGVGSGLGLSLSKKIIEAHHGSLKLIADSPNTCFEVSLPSQMHKFQALP